MVSPCNSSFYGICTDYMNLSDSNNITSNTTLLIFEPEEETLTRSKYITIGVIVGATALFSIIASRIVSIVSKNGLLSRKVPETFENIA